MKKAIRQVVILALILCCAAVFGISAWAADGGTFNAHLDIYTDEDTGIVTVTIPAENESILAEKRPQLAIPCDFLYAKVTKDDVMIPTEMKNGSVVFTAASAGTYEISPADEVTFAVYSTDSACTASVANIVVDKAEGPYYEGEKITLTAPYVFKHSFLGWYPVTDVNNGIVAGYSNEPISTDMSFTVTLSKGTPPVSAPVTAVYKAQKTTVTLTIVPMNGAKFRVGDDPNLQQGYVQPIDLGTILTIYADDESKVLQWENSSNKLLGAGPSLSLTITGDTMVKLYYINDESEQTVVQFVSDYGQLLSYQQYSSGASSVTFPPSAPTKFGYTFEKWVFEGTTEEATSANILAKIGEVDVVTIKPLYRQTTDKCSVTIVYVFDDDGYDMEPLVSTYTLGTSVTFHAPDINGYVFDHWEDDSRNILSYLSGYYRKVAQTETLYAVYGKVSHEILPVITISPASIVPGDVHKVTCTVTRSIPEGYTLIEHGVLFARGPENLTSDNMICYPIPSGVTQYVSNDTSLNGIVKVNLKLAEPYDVNTLVTYRGYMLLRNNANLIEEYYYTELVKCTYNELCNDQTGGD